MLAVVYLMVYLLCGVLCLQWLLPGQRPLYRLWLGLVFGLLLMMWLPALVAFLLSFSVIGHLVALAPLALLTFACWHWRSRAEQARWTKQDRKDLRLLLCLTVPFMLLGVWLQYTHNLRPQEGALYVGQSTYGDLALHTGIITSLRNARFPADYSILPGVRLAYPFLADSLSTTFLLLGCSLQIALILPGSLMMALVFSGFFLLALRMADRKRAAVLAFLLLFLNGGLGFLYSMDMAGVSLGTAGNHELQAGTWLDRMRTILDGWYQTPVNHAEFTTYNLRWSNIIADMLIPQRTFLAGWAFLFPCLYLLYDALQARDSQLRGWLLLGVMAGALPLVHTHSFLALGLISAGWLLRDLVYRQGASFKGWALYGCIALALALPQLLAFTFGQAQGEGFLRLQFNWVNNSGGAGLRDSYLWFYAKNIGLPFLLLVFSLFEKNPKHRMIYSGAFVIFVVAELVLFQPNEYDNNKLFYVWYAMCTIPISEYAFLLFDRLKGLRARPLVSVLVLVAFFLSGVLSIARETISNYMVYSPGAVAAAHYAETQTPPNSTFMSGWSNHLNPVAALAGRQIICGTDSWLYYHGFDTSLRKEDIRSFYADPRENRAILTKYGAEYILLGPGERSSLEVDQQMLDALYERVYADTNEEYIIYRVISG
jgi:hypothetical protein